MYLLHANWIISQNDLAVSSLAQCLNNLQLMLTLQCTLVIHISFSFIRNIRSSTIHRAAVGMHSLLNNPIFLITFNPIPCLLI